LLFISCLEPKKYVFEKDKSKIELIILNGKNYLEFDTPIRVDFKWTNIDIKTGVIYGAGIKIISSKDNLTKTEINVPSDYIKVDTLNIKVQYKKEEQVIKTEFKLPINKS